MSWLRSVSILKEVVQEIEELSPEYRTELVEALVAVISAQDQGLSVQKRRLQVLDIVRNLGIKVVKQSKDD